MQTYLTVAVLYQTKLSPVACVQCLKMRVHHSIQVIVLAIVQANTIQRSWSLIIAISAERHGRHEEHKTPGKVGIVCYSYTKQIYDCVISLSETDWLTGFTYD